MKPKITDVRIVVMFEEHEARFLGALVAGAIPRLTSEQREVSASIAAKFLRAGEQRKAELEESHGREALLDLADECIAAYPNIDEVPR